MPDWLVARTRPNCEGAVIGRLAKLGFEAYSPRYRKPDRGRRIARPRYRVRALYPCYLFVRSPEFHYFLRDVDDVTSIIMAGDLPARSRNLDEAVELLRARTQDGFIDPPPDLQAENPKFLLGERTKILVGAFAGRFGICAKIEENRIKLRIFLLGRSVDVWYRAEDVKM